MLNNLIKGEIFHESFPINCVTITNLSVKNVQKFLIPMSHVKTYKIIYFEPFADQMNIDN